MRKEVQERNDTTQKKSLSQVFWSCMGLLIAEKENFIFIYHILYKYVEDQAQQRTNFYDVYLLGDNHELLDMEGMIPPPKKYF